MKKLLALVLALVMSMSLVTISNAAFSDADKIEHTEAVEVMNALGVINGLPDGSFGPDGNVTRAQMAKMITIIMLGDVDPAAFIGTTTDLTDISGHWAEGYIKYCYSQGVIAGTGAGKFEPDANVTAVQAAKMLLVAIGYNATVQGYVGADWAINIIRDAQVSKFFEALSVTATQVLTRDEAAQMIYNAIDADLIEKTPTLDITDGTISYTYRANSSGKDLLSETFGCKRSTLLFLGDNKLNTSLKDGEVNVGGKTATYTMSNGNDWYFELVEVLWKDNTTKGTTNVLDKYDTVYGIYNNGETEVVRVTSNDIKSASDYTTAGKIKVAGVEYKVITPDNDELLVETDFGAAGYVSAPSTGASAADAKAAFSALSAQNGNSVKFILDEDGKVTLAIVTQTKLGTVTAVNSEKVTISGLGSIKLEDNSVYAGVAKNDVVTYTKLYNATLADAYVTVEKAEVVSGEVTGYKGTENVTLDGTTYKIVNKTSMPTSVGGETGTAAFAAADIGEKYDLYLVNGYVAAAVKTSETANNYSLVIDENTGTAGSTLNPLKIVALGADGTKTTLVVNDKGATTVNKGDIITYTGSADSAKVKIEKAKTATVASAANYDADSKTFAAKATTANAVLFKDTTSAFNGIASADTYKVYNLRDMKDFTAAASAYTYLTNSDGKVVAVFVGSGTTTAAKTSALALAIVSASNGVVKIGDDYYNQYVAVNNTESYTINIEQTGTDNTLTKGNVVVFAPTGDSKYDDNLGFTVLSGSAKTDATYTIDGDTYLVSTVLVKEYDETDDTLTYYTGAGTADGEGAYTAPTGLTTKGVSEKLVVVYVDAKDDVAGSEIGINGYDAQTGYANATILVDSDGLVAYVVIETSGEKQVWG